MLQYRAKRRSTRPRFTAPPLHLSDGLILISFQRLQICSAEPWFFSCPRPLIISRFISWPSVGGPTLNITSNKEAEAGETPLIQY